MSSSVWFGQTYRAKNHLPPISLTVSTPKSIREKPPSSTLKYNTKKHWNGPNSKAGLGGWAQWFFEGKRVSLLCVRKVLHGRYHNRCFLLIFSSICMIHWFHTLFSTYVVNIWPLHVIRHSLAKRCVHASLAVSLDCFGTGGLQTTKMFQFFLSFTLSYRLPGASMEPTQDRFHPTFLVEILPPLQLAEAALRPVWHPLGT